MRKFKKLAATCLTAGMTLAMSLVAMAATDVTIHFKNAAKWDLVGTWAYEGTSFKTQVMPPEVSIYNTELKHAIWPGAKMEAEQDYAGWYKIKLTYEDPAKNGAVFIFNNYVADTKVDIGSGGDPTDQAYVDAAGILKDSTKKQQTPNQVITPRNFTATEYWCDWDGVIGGSTGQLTSTKPASYKKEASKVINNFTATGLSSKKIKLTWDKFKGAQSYDILACEASSKKFVKIGSAKKNTYTVTKLGKKKLVAGKGYKFLVKAVKSKKEIAKSNTVYGVALNIPTVKSVSNTSKGKVTVKINKVSKATGYVVLRSTKAKSGYASIGTTTKTSFTDKTVKKNKTYYYKVAAYKSVSGKKAITQPSATYKKIKVKK